MELARIEHLASNDTKGKHRSTRERKKKWAIITEAKVSGMTWRGHVTMRTGIVWTIFVIVAVTMTVEADCVGCGKGNAKTVWAREDMGGRRKKVLSLDDEGLWMIDRDRNGLDVVLIIRVSIRFYSHGGFSRRRGG